MDKVFSGGTNAPGIDVFLMNEHPPSDGVYRVRFSVSAKSAGKVGFNCPAVSASEVQVFVPAGGLVTIDLGRHELLTTTDIVTVSRSIFSEEVVTFVVLEAE